MVKKQTGRPLQPGNQWKAGKTVKPATTRIRQIYEQMQEEYGRSGATDYVELRFRAIEQYLDEIALAPGRNDMMWDKELPNAIR